MRKRTYYRGPDAVVTSELFVWRTTPPKLFSIRELKNVGIVRCAVRDEIDHTRPHSAGAIGGSVVLAVALWPSLNTPVLIIVVFLAVAVPTLALTAYRHNRPRIWELHATYRGVEVVLYASNNVRVFNQVSRALRRAMEDSDPHTGWNDEVAA